MPRKFGAYISCNKKPTEPEGWMGHPTMIDQDGGKWEAQIGPASGRLAAKAAADFIEENPTAECGVYSISFDVENEADMKASLQKVVDSKDTLKQRSDANWLRDPDLTTIAESKRFWVTPRALNKLIEIRAVKMNKRSEINSYFTNLEKILN